MKRWPILGNFRQPVVLVLICFPLAACIDNPPRPDKVDKPQIRVQENQVMRSGYTCCNLHYNGDVIADSNLTHLPFIQAGTPIKLRQINGNQADVEVDGKSMKLIHDQGRSRETMLNWVDKLIVMEDPKDNMTRFSPAVRNAIARGQLLKGMTREQAIISIGYPQIDEKSRLDSPSWRYWWSSFAPYYVYWNKSGGISKIEGNTETVAQMIYKGK